MQDTYTDTSQWNETVGQLRQNLEQPETLQLIYELFNITHPQLCPDNNAQAILINEPYKIIYPTYVTHDRQGEDKTITYSLGVLIPNPRGRTHHGEDMIGITQENLDFIGNQDLPDPAFTATVEGQTLLFYTTYNQSVESTRAENRFKVDDFMFFSPLTMVNLVSRDIRDSRDRVSAADELPELVKDINEAALEAMAQLEAVEAALAKMAEEALAANTPLPSPRKQGMRFPLPLAGEQPCLSCG